jgi:glycosyltransferase involved in cell wall biosynthesis
MHEKKIKIFLGGYINYTNAQNLNCLALAKYLDSSKFTTYALSVYFLPKIKSQAIIFNCFYPFKISSFIGFLWGVFNCDVIYLPKHHSTPKFILTLSNLLGKKIFTTIEANMCDKSKERNMIKAFGGQDKLINYFSYFNNIFPITKYILDNSNCGVHLKRKVLYLGVDRDSFAPILKDNLRNIVFIGSLVNGKGTHEFVQLAKIFTKFKFHIIGDGPLRKELENISSGNVVFHGLLANDQLKHVLNNMDLHLLLSRNEGFPKVILETAASGIPSILYSDYGAEEWIRHRKNGFVVNNIQDVVEIIKKLEKNNILLSEMSKEVSNLSKLFDWKLIIRDWEKVICNLR